MSGADGAELIRIFLAGLRESLNCSVAALVIAIVATLLAAAGSFRLRRSLPAAEAISTATGG